MRIINKEHDCEGNLTKLGSSVVLLDRSLQCLLGAQASQVRWSSGLAFLDKKICDVGIVADLIMAFGLY